LCFRANANSSIIAYNGNTILIKNIFPHRYFISPPLQHLKLAEYGFYPLHLSDFLFEKFVSSKKNATSLFFSFTTQQRAPQTDWAQQSLELIYFMR